MCEDLPPREMSNVIETYFSRYLGAIHAFGGSVTEVMGDGLLAIFEGPDRAHNATAAVSAADGIRVVTIELNRLRAGRHDPISVHIGMNAGPALVGLVRLRSGVDERWFYAATGPVSNVAARLCALASGGQVLTTKAVAGLLPSTFGRRSQGRKRFKNVTDPVDVVEIDPTQAGSSRGTSPASTSSRSG